MKPRKDWITKAIMKFCSTKEKLYKLWKRNPNNTRNEKNIRNLRIS